jgi:hypothetical protein
MERQGKIVTYTTEELQRMTSQTDWAAVQALTDEEIEAHIAADPDAGAIDVPALAQSAAYRPWLLQHLKDPTEAAAYLTAAFEEGDSAVLLLALQDVAEALGLCSHPTALPTLPELSAFLARLGLEVTIGVKAA